MGAVYELWITTPSGDRIQNIKDYFWVNYSLVVNGISTCNLGLAFDDFKDIFAPDRRLEVWRSPDGVIKTRLEETFWLLKPKTYTRDDNVSVLHLAGNGPNDLLNRRVVAYPAGTSQATKTDAADDMMKEIVRENLGAGATNTDRNLESTGFFQIQADVTAGTSLTYSFANRIVYDVIKDIAEQASQIGDPVFFDIVPLSPTVFEFQTFTGQRGANRLDSKMIFSLENGNMRLPFLEEDYFNEANVARVGGMGQGEARTFAEVEDTERSLLTIWNRKEVFTDARGEDTTAGLTGAGQSEIESKRPQKRFYATFLNAKNSLYGFDWNLGDKVRAIYADKDLETEIKAVYVSVKDTGEENIVGRNEIGTAV